MALVRRIARPLLAAPFVFEGVRTALRPERDIDVYPQAFDAADSALAKTSAPSFVDSRNILRISGAVAAGAGVGDDEERAHLPKPATSVTICPRGSAGGNVRAQEP